MNVLVACEESQRVCIAFREKGHNAFSCDILPCSGVYPEWHIQGDVLPLLNGHCGWYSQAGLYNYLDAKWDLIIAHPPCTYLSKAAVKHFGALHGQWLNNGAVQVKTIEEDYNNAED